MKSINTNIEVRELSKISGSLSQLARNLGQKTWKKQFTALGTSESGKGLCLYFFSEVTSTTLFRKKNPTSGKEEEVINLKLKSELELEEGCEARALSPEDAPFNQQNCFMLVTSKNQLKFQASSLQERDRWVQTLNKEFELEMEFHLNEQKTRLLRKGGVLTWHRPAKFGGPSSVKVFVDDEGFVYIGESPKFPLSQVETVVAGNESEVLRAKEDIYHFNCFVIRLRMEANDLFPSCLSIDFEAPKQSTRDDWVSALEARLKDEGIFFNPSLGRQEPAVSRLNRSASNMEKVRTGTIDKGRTPTIDKGRAPTIDKGRSGTIDNKIGLPRKNPSSLLLKNPSERNQSIPQAPDQFETAGDGETKLKARTVSAMSIDEEDNEEEENDPKQQSTGIGEMFKQKVKLGGEFPYSRCVAFALETALKGEKADFTLTPNREIMTSEIEAITHYLKLELPPNQADIQSAAKARKKLKRVIFDMHDYAPSAFKELRNRWGISDSAYFRSVSQLSGDGAVGDGKSGMLFFFTRDRRYVLKTVKTNEMNVLMQDGFVKAYIRYMAENPDSLICRFFGLYTFKLGKPAREINLVCMQNSFDTRLVLHEKYDLKGSTRNRWCTPRFGSVLKDLNFGNTKLYLDAVDRQDFLKQCEKDTALMEGIHKPSDDPEKVRRNLVLLSMANQLELKNTPNQQKSGSIHPKPTRWQRDFGGLEGINQETSQHQVYIMCVIDILQAYDFGKKAENLIKSQMTEEVKEISAVNPKTYRTRFLSYMAKITVGVPNQNAILFTQRKELKMKMRMESTQQQVKRIPPPIPLVAAPVPTTPERRTTLLSAVKEEDRSEVSPIIIKQAPPPVPKRPSMATPATTTTSIPTPTIITKSEPPTPRGVSSSISVETGDNDEDQLQAEIAAAIEEAEQEKKNAAATGADVGGAYTEVLEDGTEIVILEDGGFIQRMPNGIVIQKFPDGAKKQTNPDGSTIDVTVDGIVTCRLADGTEIVHVEDSENDVIDIQKNPDGSSIETLRDGSTVQKNVDGSRIEIAINGDKRTFFPDGIIIEESFGGAKRQTNPDGLTIVSLADGTRVQTDAKLPHMVLTTYSDGTSLQEDKSDGVTIRTEKDGSELHKFPDGSTIQISSDKHVIQTNADGTVIETFPDGKQIQKNPDGSIIQLT